MRQVRQNIKCNSSGFRFLTAGIRFGQEVLKRGLKGLYHTGFYKRDLSLWVPVKGSVRVTARVMYTGPNYSNRVSG